MADFRQKQKMRKVLYSRFTLLALAFLLLIGIVNTWDIYTKARLSRQTAERSREEYEELKKQEEILSQKVNRLQTDSGIEAEIRERYGVAKPGEQMIMILDTKEEKKEEDTGGIFTKIKNWFRR